jgi:hypothetical protein
VSSARGKRLVVLVTDAGAVRTSLARDRRGDRRTLLADRLRGNVARVVDVVP